MSVMLIADIGSCHMGKLTYAKEAIDIAIDSGVDVLKFQLFPDTHQFTSTGNIPLDIDIFQKAYEYAEGKNFKITASVFSQEALNTILEYDVPFVKLAYSQRKQGWWIKQIATAGKKLMVSCDFLEAPEHRDSFRLMCISSYPVLYKVSFDHMFPWFDGFSSHCLGIEQDKNAVRWGAKIIEKHMTLDHSDVNCPDNLFALKPKQMGELAHWIKSYSSDQKVESDLGIKQS